MLSTRDDRIANSVISFSPAELQPPHRPFMRGGARICRALAELTPRTANMNAGLQARSS